MEKIVSVIVIFYFFLFGLFAHDKILLKEKPGTFKITTGTLNGQGPDQYMKSYGYYYVYRLLGELDVKDLLQAISH